MTSATRPSPLFRAILWILAPISGAALPAAAADTVQDFTTNYVPPSAPQRYRLDQFQSDPGASVQSSGWDGKFLRLASPTTSQLNVISFPQASSGGYVKLTIGFEFRIDNGPEGADGFGVAFLHSNVYGDSLDSAPPVISEEPNFTASFGFGVDTWNNGVASDDAAISPDFATLPNSYSVHWDGRLVETRPLLFGQTFESPGPGEVYRVRIEVEPHLDLVTVEVAARSRVAPPIVFDRFSVPGLAEYDGRLAIGSRTGAAFANHDVDNVYVEIQQPLGAPVRVLTEDFEAPNGKPQPPPELAGGTPFALSQLWSRPGPQVVAEDGAPLTPTTRAGFLRLAHESEAQHGLAAFDRTSARAERIVARFAFRGTDSGALGRADGGSFLLLDAAVYGDTGAPTIPDLVGEEPNVPAAFAAAFDTFSLAVDSPEEGVRSPEAPISNHVSLHWNSHLVAAHQFDRARELDLVAGVFHAVEVELEPVAGGSQVSMTIVDGTDGSVHTPFVNVFVPGLRFDAGARVALAARTGGYADNYDFDDVHVSFGDAGGGFRRGECNGDGIVDLSDAVCVLSWLFSGGRAPGCLAAANLNNDEAVNISDPTYLLSHLFLGGPEPLAPFRSCGTSSRPADATLGCRSPPGGCE